MCATRFSGVKAEAADSVSLQTSSPAGRKNRTMRELFLDAAEAVWWLMTAPLRRVVGDALEEVLDRRTSSKDASPALKWTEDGDPELPLQMPEPRPLIDRLLHR